MTQALHTLIAQGSTPTPHLDVSYRMGQIVGILVLVIIVLVGAKKLGIVRPKR